MLQTVGGKQGKPKTVGFDPLEMTAEIPFRLTLSVERRNLWVFSHLVLPQTPADVYRLEADSLLC